MQNAPYLVKCSSDACLLCVSECIHVFLSDLYLLLIAKFTFTKYRWMVLWWACFPIIDCDLSFITCTAELLPFTWLNWIAKSCFPLTICDHCYLLVYSFSQVKMCFDASAADNFWTFHVKRNRILFNNYTFIYRDITTVRLDVFKVTASAWVLKCR